MHTTTHLLMQVFRTYRTAMGLISLLALVLIISPAQAEEGCQIDVPEHPIVSLDSLPQNTVTPTSVIQELDTAPYGASVTNTGNTSTVILAMTVAESEGEIVLFFQSKILYPEETYWVQGQGKTTTAWNYPYNGGTDYNDNTMSIARQHAESSWGLTDLRLNLWEMIGDQDEMRLHLERMNPDSERIISEAIDKQCRS